MIHVRLISYFIATIKMKVITWYWCELFYKHIISRQNASYRHISIVKSKIKMSPTPFLPQHIPFSPVMPCLGLGYEDFPYKDSFCVLQRDTGFQNPEPTKYIQDMKNLNFTFDCLMTVLCV